MASSRFIKWRNRIFDTREILARDEQIWRRNVGPLTRCLLACLDGLEFSDDPLDAVDVLKEDIERIARVLFPENYQWQQDSEERQAQIHSAARSSAKGSIPAQLRKAVFERDAFRCRQCGDHHDLCADHIIPECQGGPTTLDNLQTLCRPCNSRKAGTMPE
jgi:5-methylcytosine-specific restriction endonuclease McrA